MLRRLPLASSVYWIYLGLKRIFTGVKHTCEIDLTNNCNLACLHCYFYEEEKSRKNEELPLKIWAKRFSELYAEGIRKILFVGGEPALRLDILELADSIFPVLHVITNGTIKIPNSFKHILFLSIDGMEETNDRIRGAGTFRKLLENYKNDPRVIINMTLSIENYKELEDVVKLSIKNRFAGVVCNIYCCTTDCNDQYKKFLPGDIHLKIIKEIRRIKKRFPAQLLFTGSIINWYKQPDHTASCYWRENVDHYNVHFKRRTCFMDEPDCSRCGCYAGAFSSIANKPLELAVYLTKYLINRTTRLFRKGVALLFFSYFILSGISGYCQGNAPSLKELRASAIAGNLESQVKLGNSYFLGTHGVKDPALAYKWYKSAVDAGSQSACFNLALCFENGVGVKKDKFKAFHLYKQAAEVGVPQAEFNVAMCYKNGIYDTTRRVELLKPDLIIAENKLEALTEKKFYPAFRALAEIYLQQKDEKKLDKAFTMLRKAAFRKDAQAMNLLADCFKNGWGCKTDMKEMVSWLERATDAGSMVACAKLAYCYEHGEGVDSDPEKALRLYAKAAARGLPAAQIKMGNAYAYGNFVQQDVVMAKKWYERAARADNARGFFMLGFFALQGIGEKRDENRAAILFLQAAKLGEPHAQFNIANFFANGKGVPVDPKAAFFWYKRSAEQNTPKAQRELAFCYFKGTGTKKDFQKGMKWLKKAVKNGDLEAKKFLDDILPQ